MGEVVCELSETIAWQESFSHQPAWRIYDSHWAWKWISAPMRAANGYIWYILIRETSVTRIWDAWSAGDYDSITFELGNNIDLNPETYGFFEYEGGLAPKSRFSEPYIGTFLYSRLYPTKLVGVFLEVGNWGAVSDWMVRHYDIPKALRLFEIVAMEKGFRVFCVDVENNERWYRVVP